MEIQDEWVLVTYRLDEPTFRSLQPKGDPAWAIWASLHHDPDSPVLTYEEDKALAKAEAEVAADFSGVDAKWPMELPGIRFLSPGRVAAEAEAEVLDERR